jgi:hypothetical protein
LEAWLTDVVTKAGLGVLVTSAVALIAAIAGVLTSLLVSRRTTYINAVTVERSKWINELRNNLSKFCSVFVQLHFRYFDRDEKETQNPEEEGLAKELSALHTYITLQLNPNNDIDSNMLKIIDQFTLVIGRENQNEMNKMMNTFMRHSQFLLKEEWERVKFEASGFLPRIAGRLKRIARRRAYRKFCESDEGSLRLLKRARA